MDNHLCRKNNKDIHEWINRRMGEYGWTNSGDGGEKYKARVTEGIDRAWA